MGEIQTTKVEYKITTSIEGNCPHCLKTIDIKKVEEFSDDKIVGLRGERKPPVSTVGIANPLGE